MRKTKKAPVSTGTQYEDQASKANSAIAILLVDDGVTCESRDARVLGARETHLFSHALCQVKTDSYVSTRLARSQATYTCYSK